MQFAEKHEKINWRNGIVFAAYVMQSRQRPPDSNGPKSVQLNHLHHDESRLKVGSSWTGTSGSGTTIGGDRRARVWWPFIPCRVIKWSITIHEGDQPWNACSLVQKTLDKGQVAVSDREVTRPSLTYDTILYRLEMHHYSIKRDIQNQIASI